ncbi:MAG: TatD family hydrolase [Verrucomicrobiales bacterium]
MNLSLYDAHVHLQLFPLKENAPSIFEELQARGLCKAVVNGTREEDWEDVAALARNHDWIIPAFGLHPWHTRQATSEWQHNLISFLDRQPSSIGEIGLDKWIENPDLDTQTEAFTFQLRQAREKKIPATIHCLKAWGLLLEILKKEGPFPDGFLIHSYGGSAEMIKQLADQGAYFSLSGYFAHSRKGKQQTVFRQIPRDRLLLETDAPDMLPPENRRALELKVNGKEWNHPANIEAVYHFAGELLQWPVKELALQVEENFMRLFGQH